MGNKNSTSSQNEPENIQESPSNVQSENIQQSSSGMENLTQKKQKKQINTKSMFNSAALSERNYPQFDPLANLQLFDDDQPLNLPLTESAKSFSPFNPFDYDLEKGVSFELKPVQKAFKLSSTAYSSIPVMLSVKTKDSTVVESKSKEGDVDLSARPGIDLICVLDRSGSMTGEKMELLKKTLEYLIDLLNEKDRICIISFDSIPTLEIPFSQVTTKNVPVLKNNIEKLYARGGTNIDFGMKFAFKALKDRRYKNQVTSVFLLSDGLDNGACDKVVVSLAESGIIDNFTIHTFGFGKDHDPVLMADLAKIKDGNFYYIETLSQVDECFVDALGGLFSVVVESAKIQLSLKRPAPFTDHSIEKVFGNMWIPQGVGNQYNINLLQLMSGVSKEYIFLIQMPPCSFQVGDHERNAVLAGASIELKKVGNLKKENVKDGKKKEVIEVAEEEKKDGEEKSYIQKQSELLLTFYNEDEEIPPDSEEVDEEVMFNLFRVKGAEVLEEVMKKAALGKYEEGNQDIEGFLDGILKSKPNTQFRLRGMVEDLKIVQQNCQPKVYEDFGMQQMVNFKKAHMEQRSMGVKDQDMYCNKIQSSMTKELRRQK